MTKATNTGTPADPTPTPDTKPTEMSADDQRTKFQAELKRYTDKFGAADGATYFSTGLNYEQALEKHVEKLDAASKAAETAKMSAEQKLAALNLGERSAVDSGGKPGEGAEGKTTFSTCFKAATEKANAAK